MPRRRRWWWRRRRWQRCRHHSLGSRAFGSWRRNASGRSRCDTESRRVASRRRRRRRFRVRCCIFIILLRLVIVGITIAAAAAAAAICGLAGVVTNIVVGLLFRDLALQRSGWRRGRRGRRHCPSWWARFCGDGRRRRRRWCLRAFPHSLLVTRSRVHFSETRRLPVAGAATRYFFPKQTLPTRAAHSAPQPPRSRACAALEREKFFFSSSHAGGGARVGPCACVRRVSCLCERRRGKKKKKFFFLSATCGETLSTATTTRVATTTTTTRADVTVAMAPMEKERLSFRHRWPQSPGRRH